MDSSREYACKRLQELESLLLADVPETVWPAEVSMVFAQIEKAGTLPAPHQRRLQQPYQPYVAGKNARTVNYRSGSFAGQRHGEIRVRQSEIIVDNFAGGGGAARASSWRLVVAWISR